MDDASTTPEGPAARLHSVWQIHVDSDDTLFERLAGRHREKHRRYHVLAHVDAVVRHVGQLATTEHVNDLGAVIAAALYHDAIYEPESPANERASARLARRDLGKLGWPQERIAAVAEMIEGTKHHREPTDIDSAVLFDADLAVLGAGHDDYDAYVGAVRAEYRHVDDDDWVKGRSDVLRSFIDRDEIFATESGRQAWEQSARSNLQRELDTIS